MDAVEDEIVYADHILAQVLKPSDVTVENPIMCRNNPETNCSQEKTNSAVWTSNSVFILLKLYESKLEMLEHPKKKTRIWMAISDSLKDYSIEMTPDQVRWKINALTKKYKQCVDSRQHNKFKYFKELNNIFAHYKLASDTYYSMSEVNQKNKSIAGCQSPLHESQTRESKTIIELRKRRLADKIDADIYQRKVKLEKQWLEYLKRQEECQLVKDEIFDKSLKLREEELKLRKRQVEMREAFELRRLHILEKQQEEMIKFEREKCEIMKKVFAQRIY